MIDFNIIDIRFVRAVVASVATGVSVLVEENGSGVSGLGRSGISVGIFFSVEEVGVNSV